MGASPARTGSFEVEFEIPEDVTEWAPATSGSTAISGSSEVGAEVRIDCEIERVGAGDDLVVDARLGLDVLLVEVLSRRSDLAVGALISLRVNEVRLYPYFL